MGENLPLPASEQRDQPATARALLAILRGWTCPAGPNTLALECDWPAILSLANQSKTIGLISAGLLAQGIKAPEAVENQLKVVQTRILQNSMVNLGWTAKAIKVLDAAKIECIAFKGAIQTYCVYAAWDKRRSADIDLFVRRSDFDRAKEALCANGFDPGLETGTKWWSHHLGELPFVLRDGPNVVIDLHHQLQQPGGPFPRDLERFFADKQILTFSGKQLPVLSKMHSILVKVICYGKARRHGEPWLHYAHELILSLAGMSDEDRETLIQMASSQGLRRLYDEAIRSSYLLFGERAPPMPADCDDEFRDIFASAMAARDNPHFFRSRKLWEWTDGNGLRRASDFARSLTRIAYSEASRLSPIAGAGKPLSD